MLNNPVIEVSFKRDKDDTGIVNVIYPSSLLGLNLTSTSKLKTSELIKNAMIQFKTHFMKNGFGLGLDDVNIQSIETHGTSIKLRVYACKTFIMESTCLNEKVNHKLVVACIMDEGSSYQRNLDGSSSFDSFLNEIKSSFYKDKLCNNYWMDNVNAEIIQSIDMYLNSL